MAAEAKPRPRRRRLRRLLWWLAILVVAFHVGGGWYFSGVMHERALSGEARRASRDFDPDVTVQAITEDTIVLRAIDPDDPPSGLDLPGVYGLRWEGGHGTVGGVLSAQGDDVARAFRIVTGSAPATGTRAELDFVTYLSPAEAGVDAADVTVPGPSGDLPAWFVEGSRDTWVVLVHGNSMSRLDNVRWLPALRDAGYPTLTIGYRNDEGAPEDPSGLLRYGLTEWMDLEASVTHALEHGARDVVLMGDSMGGGVIADFMERSAHEADVRALVLDAPMLNFSSTVDDNAAREPLLGPVTVPPSLTWVAKQMATIRFGVAWDELDYITPWTVDVPTLIIHGDEDLTVPIATSREAAQRFPDTIAFHVCPGADHVECWNSDPEAMQALVTGFLSDVLS